MRNLIFGLSVIIMVISAMLPSCRHELILPLGPDSQDTIPNLPIDSADYSGTPCNPDTVYFQNQVLPLLISQCTKSGCHDVASHKEGVVLVDYQRIISTGDVTPFKPQNSDLYRVLNKTDPKDRMPPSPDAPLTTDQKNLIKKWIEQGAQNNVCNENYGGCSTNNVTYSNFVNPLMANRCVGCHAGSNPVGKIKLTTYDEVKVSAQNGTLYGSIAHVQGFKPMPDGGNALSACFVDKIKAWIDSGMPQ